MNANELRSLIAGFYGSDQCYKWSILFPRCRLSEGMKAVCQAAGAYWLADLIASYQPKCLKDPMLRDLQFWKLTVKDGKAVVTCERDENDVFITQKIKHTDFPEGEWSFSVGPAYYGEQPNEFNMLICLPAER